MSTAPNAPRPLATARSEPNAVQVERLAVALFTDERIVDPPTYDECRVLARVALDHVSSHVAPHYVCDPTAGCGASVPMVRAEGGWRPPRSCPACGKDVGLDNIPVVVMGAA